MSARFVTPAGGTFGASSVVDASGAVAPHVVIEPDVATPPAGETDGDNVPGDSSSKSPADANPAAGELTTGPTANPALKPAATTTKTSTTVTKTTVAKTTKPKTATTTTATLTQDRRQQLDHRFRDAFPAWYSASSCRMSLLKHPFR